MARFLFEDRREHIYRHSDPRHILPYTSVSEHRARLLHPHPYIVEILAPVLEFLQDYIVDNIETISFLEDRQRHRLVLDLVARLVVQRRERT